MEVRAKAKYIKMSPRKIRLVADVVRGMAANRALEQLKFINKKATLPITKLLNSGIANAINNYELDKDNLYIKEIRVDEGPVLKRWQPKAHGRATPIRKRMGHISLVLEEIKISGKKKARKEKLEAPVRLDSSAKEAEGLKVEEKKEKKQNISPALREEKGKEIVDLRSEGSGKHAKIEGGGSRGFMKKIFRRKSG